MRVVIEFNLPEEQEEYDLVHNAGKMHTVLWDFDNKLRDIAKWGHDGYDLDTVERLRDELHELIDDNGLEL